jgi:SPP1 gp7 family putative phage head morphogenesis protein
MTTRVEFASAGVAPNGDVTPEEAAKIRASVASKEQAPSTQQQATFVNWRQAADQLGQPFEVERIPISKLRAMRRDPMLGFGLNFIKTPIVRAKWYASAHSNQGPNAQIAAHLDHDLRRIYTALVLADMNKLDFGFQAIAKRFELGIPAGTYTETDPDTGEQSEKPIWSEGGIQPVRWKPFVSLPPEYVNPIWNGKGDFDGIDLNTQGVSPPAGVVGQRKDYNYKIDVFHSLWSTNEREQNFGSLFGYPRLGYAYRYWWSYWFRWAIADRAFEKKADPSIVVRHPEGEFVDEETGASMPFREYALLMGERLRSGSTVAMSSEPYFGEVDGKPVSIYQWQIEFLKDATNFDPFDKSFDYLDVQKLRALFIPEQAFLEGKGGTSSRNVASEQFSNFTESQAVLAAQFVDSVNRWVIPQWLATNYPEFMADGGKAEMIMSGFADEDVEFTREVIQLIGQQPTGANEILKIVDLKRVLENAGTPIADFNEQNRKMQEIASQAAASPPEVAPQPGGVGVIPSPASATGFSYVNGPEPAIYLSDSGTDFIENLPTSPHFEDKSVRALARQLWTQYRKLYRDDYEAMIAALEDESVTLADEHMSEAVEFSMSDYIDQANKLIKKIQRSPLWEETIRRTVDIFDTIANRAHKVEAKKAGLKAQFAEDEWTTWRNDHIAEFAGKVAETTTTELRDFIASQLNSGVTDKAELIKNARAHFSDHPDWKTDRLVRTEVRDVYNAGTLFAAKAAGIDAVQASDAEHGHTDADCMRRDGKIFKIADAFKEREHPNGTLSWKLLPVELSVQRTDDLDEGLLGRFDKENNVVYLSTEATDEDERQFLLAVGEALTP